MIEQPRKGARPIEVDGEQWWFRVGRSGANIEVWSPFGNRHVVTGPGITGLTYDDIDRGQWKKTSDGMIKPGHVRGHIRKVRDALK